MQQNKIAESKNEGKKEIKLTRGQTIKSMVLGVLTLGAGFLAWFAIARILNNGLRFDSANIWLFIFDVIFPVLAFCLWVAFIGIDAIFIRKKIWVYPLALLSIIPLFMFFPLNIYALIAFTIIVLAYLYFIRGARRERRDRIKFHLINCLKVHLGLTLIFCIAAISLLFYSHMAEKQKNGQTNTNDVVASSTADLVNLFLESQFSNYNPDQTLDEFILQSGQQFIEQLGPQLGEGVKVESSFQTENLINKIEEAINRGEIKRDDLPAELLQKLDEGRLTASDVVDAQLTSLFTDQLAAGRDDFLKQLGVEAKGTDKISEVVKKIVSHLLSEGLLPFVTWLPPFLAISLFFTLAIFDFLYVIFVKIIALLIYLVLLISKFIIVKKETKEVEVAELS
ncbi:MAG: hypothetical protein WC528_01880 [Patescibacteria group bacterium]